VWKGKRKEEGKTTEPSSPTLHLGPLSFPLYPRGPSGPAASQPEPALFPSRAAAPARFPPLLLSLAARSYLSVLFFPLPPFLPGVQRFPRTRRRAALTGPARQGSLAALQRGSPEPRVLTLALRRPRTLSSAAPCSAASPSLPRRRAAAPERHRPRQPPRSPHLTTGRLPEPSTRTPNLRITGISSRSRRR
jgi:hypothetical protein